MLLKNLGNFVNNADLWTQTNDAKMKTLKKKVSVLLNSVLYTELVANSSEK